MKMRFKLFAVVIPAIWLVLVPQAVHAKKGNLYDLFQGKRTSFFIADIKDSANLKKEDVASLKKKIGDALVNRKSLIFEQAKSPSEAKITVECHIQKFRWLKEDPVDDIKGMAVAAWDAMTNQNYAQIHVHFAVNDRKTGKVLWRKLLRASVTEKDMPEEASIPKVMDDIVRVFLRDALSKKRSKIGS